MIDNMPNEWWQSIILCEGDVELWSYSQAKMDRNERHWGVKGEKLGKVEG
jgi:hypothetical protein